MGRVAGNTSRIYVNEHNLTGRTNTIELVIDNQIIEVTCFGDDALEFVEGNYQGRLNQNSFFDGDGGQIDESIWAEIGATNAALCGFYFGNDASYGDVGYEIQARPNDEARPLEVAGAVLLNVNWQGSGAAVRGTVLSNVAVAATGAVANSAQNLGATTAPTVFVAVVRILAVSGGGSITVDIEQSSDNGGGDAYALIAGMQTTKTAVGQQRLTTVASTEAWKRVNVTAFSGFSSVTLMVTCGYEQGT